MNASANDTFAILGFGRFGQAFCGLLRQAGYPVRVYDPAADVPADVAAASPAAAVAEAGWVILAMPVAFMRQALQELRPLLRADQVVMDVGSVKQEPEQWRAEILGDAFAHIGAHPLFGPISLARGDRPRRVVLCVSHDHPDVLPRAKALFESLDCDVVERTPAEHDQAMARTHAMAFFIAKALVEMGVGEDLSLAPPSFLGLRHMLDAVRGDAGHLFPTIQGENPYAPAARQELIDHLVAIHQRLEAGDDASLIIPN
ncbi:MAG TPA: prephenate dehydrogenase/arogenate dehydrogenase family protein [Rhodanobacteraceae bacterium]